MRQRLHSLFAASLLALAVAMPAVAADAGVRVRGTLLARTGDVLEVKAREGDVVRIKLKEGLHVNAVARAAISDIKQGDYVGIASLPKAQGGDGALEVLIFPAALKGVGEGSYGWDLRPKSSMTNATVSNAVKSVEGSTVTLSYHGQEKKVSIQNGTPIVTLIPATTDDLRPGAAVFVSAEKAGDGSLSSGQVVVGKDGVVPPM